MERKLVNTQRDEAHPEWAMGGNPGAIEAQEARGQEQFVKSDFLPVDCHDDDRRALEARGITFGKLLPDDPMFCEATLPQGWKKQPTDHSMWSELLDENGKVVAQIFYKAAFYDRSASIRLA